MSYCVWLTGCPSAGKTTIGRPVSRKLGAQFLDGDVIRSMWISKGIGFSKEERRLHLLRIAEFSKMLVENGVPVVASFVSPYVDVRNEIADIIGRDRFHEVYVKASQLSRIERDPKGMYQKAIDGEIKSFTGLTAPYEEPENPCLVLDTNVESKEDSIQKLMDYCESMKDARRRCVYIGRWSPFHKGHHAIIQEKLDAGECVSVLIRDTALTEGDPWTANERKEMIEASFEGDDRVVVKIIPDVASVVIGRKVGYEIEEMKMPENIEEISGTKVRESLQSGTDYWRGFVSPGTAKWLENNI